MMRCGMVWCEVGMNSGMGVVLMGVNGGKEIANGRH